MFKKILLAHDTSQCSWKAFEVAADLAKKYDAELVVLHVIDTTPIPDIPHKDVLVKPLEERAQKLGELLKKKFEELGIKGDYVVKKGKPVEEIVKFADEIGADLVVLGARGLGMVSGYLLGSVSTKVVMACKKSVLVVKAEVPAASPLL